MSSNKTNLPRIVSLCLLILLLFHVSCGAPTSEVRKPEPVSATLEEPSRNSASTATRKPSFNIEYLNPINDVDPKEVFGSYLAQDAVWVEKHQLFVNQEFDFSVAMGMPDIGAGIAAKKRQEANKNVSDRLASIPGVNLQEAFEKSLKKYQDRQQESFHATVALYGLLFGDKKARLQSVLEVTGDTAIEEATKATSIRFVTVSEQKPLTGEGSWTSDNGAALVETMRINTEELVSLFYEYRQSTGEISSTDAEDKPTAKCPVGGNQKTKGAIVEKRKSRTVLRLDRSRPTLLSCDSESLLQ